VYDDKIVLTFNYKEGTKAINLDDVNGSDMVGYGPPEGNREKALGHGMGDFLLSTFNLQGLIGIRLLYTPTNFNPPRPTPIFSTFNTSICKETERKPWATMAQGFFLCVGGV
jgi:hypothetical protein